MLILVVVIAIVIAFYKPITMRLLANVTKMQVFGVTLEFSQEPVQNLLKDQVPGEDFARVFYSVNNRLRLVSRLIYGAKVLWIDDNHPVQNIRERELIREMGLFADRAQNNEEAQLLLDETTTRSLHDYDVIISDNSRGTNHTAGQEFFAQLSKRPSVPKLIL